MSQKMGQKTGFLTHFLTHFWPKNVKNPGTLLDRSGAPFLAHFLDLFFDQKVGRSKIGGYAFFEKSGFENDPFFGHFFGPFLIH